MHRNRNRSPLAEDLERHFVALTQALRHGDPAELDRELVARSIEGLWRHNKELTRKLAGTAGPADPPALCASCKRVRKGEEHWEEVETYLLDRHDVEVSHTICPKCKTERYPE